MKGYIENLEDVAQENENFREVLYTGKNMQLVIMSLRPGEEIGEEVHDNIDQFIRLEGGEGKATVDNIEYPIEDDFAVFVPAGSKHNIINTSETEDLKLYTLYSPPEHRDGAIHATKEDSMRDTTDEFDGQATE